MISFEKEMTSVIIYGVIADDPARPADSGENSGRGRGRGDLQWSLTFGPKLPHCGHRYCSPLASSIRLADDRRYRSM